MTLRFLTAGESHGPAIVAILEGMPAGLALNPGLINRQLARRQRGYGAGPRMKIEHDTVRILAGVMEGRTIGSPIALTVENRDHARWAGRAITPFVAPRPGHADLAAAIKYGYDDLRPSLERASARETVARVAIGAVCLHLLEVFGISVGGYVVGIGEVDADVDDIPLAQRAQRAEADEVRCPDPAAAAEMAQAIRKAMQQRDTLGGVVEVLALGVPPGLGSHVQSDRRLDAKLGGAVLSVQAVKGVEVGPAFRLARALGTQAHDPIRLDGETLTRPTHKNGGTEGGITTGQPLLIRAAMKPIATTLTPQQTVNLAMGEESLTTFERSDFCPVPRLVPILEAVVAFVLAEALIEKLGGDSLAEMLPRFATLRRAQLPDLQMGKTEREFWPLAEA